MGYSPQGRNESNTIEVTSLMTNGRSWSLETKKGKRNRLNW